MITVCGIQITATFRKSLAVATYPCNTSLWTVVHLIFTPGVRDNFFSQIEAAILNQNKTRMRNSAIDQIGQFIFKLFGNNISTSFLFYTMATSTCSLVEQFDDIVAATDVLCAGIEGGKGILRCLPAGKYNLNAQQTLRSLLGSKCPYSTNNRRRTELFRHVVNRLDTRCQLTFASLTSGGKDDH